MSVLMDEAERERIATETLSKFIALGGRICADCGEPIMPGSHGNRKLCGDCQARHLRERGNRPRPQAHDTMTGLRSGFNITLDPRRLTQHSGPAIQPFAYVDGIPLSLIEKMSIPINDYLMTDEIIVEHGGLCECTHFMSIHTGRGCAACTCRTVGDPAVNPDATT